MKFRKFVAIVSLICMAFSLAPASVFAVEESEYDGYIYSVDDEIHTADTIKEIYQETDKDDIEYIEPNYKTYLFDYSYKPNDFYYSNQKWIFDILNVTAVWKNGIYGSANGKPVTVAVIDSGVTQHPDIPNLLKGTSFNNQKKQDVASDNNFHGTFVAGIIASQNNNNIGISGLMPDVNILPIRVFDKNGEANIDDIIMGINEAVDRDVDVINMSYGNSHKSIAEEAAIQRAIDKNIIVVAAAGNEGKKHIFYPAGYSNVIGVGALGHKGNTAYVDNYSNYNKSVDVVAPGTHIYSTIPEEYTNTRQLDSYLGRGYAVGSGTSFATPHISAMAAMAKSVKGSINSSEFLELIKKTSRDDDSGNGYDEHFGWGIPDFNAIYLNMTLKGELSKTSYTYSGKTIHPVPVVTDLEGKEIGKDNYTLSYSSGSKSVGKYTVSIKLKNNYAGTIKLSYKIVPKGTSISLLSESENTVKVKWKKQSKKMASKRISGYQVQISKDADFKADSKTYTVKKYTSTSKKITKLDSNTEYYVRVRTYLGNYKSSWSNVKTIEVE